MSEVYSAYPLQWPTGWKRTTSGRTSAKFLRDKRQLSVMDGVQRVLDELERMGVNRNDIVISTNVAVRLDGLPRSDQAQPSDPGAAVYWRQRNKATRVMAADHYSRVADNLAAIAATLEALRAIERHGGAQILDRAFTGFTALPAPGASQHWRDVLGVPSDVRTLDGVRNCYRMSASAAHPDRQGGSHDRMALVNAAWEQAQRELSGG